MIAATRLEASASLPLHRRLPDLQARITRASVELSTGHLQDAGLSLGVRSGHVSALAEQREDYASILVTNGLTAARLSASQSALKQMGELLQNLQSDAIAALASPGGPATDALVQRAQSVISGMADLANSQIAGIFVFGGTAGDQQPFPSPGSPAFVSATAALESGFQAAFAVSSSDPLVESIIDTDLQTYFGGAFASQFQAPSWTTNWSQASDEPIISRIGADDQIGTSMSLNEKAFTSAFEALFALTTTGLQSQNAAAKQVTIKASIDAIAASLTDLTSAQSRLGNAEQRVSDNTVRLDIAKAFLDREISLHTSVDPAEAATRLADLTAKLEAAYAATARLQQLSLINFL